MSAVGQTVHLTAVTRDITGALFDLTSPQVSITTPAGVTTAFTPTRVSIGTYFYDYIPLVPGNFIYSFSGTGNVQPPDVFTVTATTSVGLVSLADVKAQLNKTSSTDDAELLRYILAATEIINSECGYTASTPGTETINLSRADSSGNNTVVLSRTPVLSVQSITPQLMGLPVYDLSTLVIDNEAGVIYFSNWWQFYGPATIAYTAGRGFVPPALQTACLMIVQHMWETQRGGGVLALDQDVSTQAGSGLPYQALQLMQMAPYSAAPGIA